MCNPHLWTNLWFYWLREEMGVPTLEPACWFSPNYIKDGTPTLSELPYLIWFISNNRWHLNNVTNCLSSRIVMPNWRCYTLNFCSMSPIHSLQYHKPRYANPICANLSNLMQIWHKTLWHSSPIHNKHIIQMSPNVVCRSSMYSSILMTKFDENLMSFTF